MAPRETEDNAYAKFWGDKQRPLWYVMVFLELSIVFVVKTTALHVHHAFLVQFLDVHCKATMWNLPMQVLSFKKEVNT